ncbi:MBL fold metallo-hydrolase [Roseicyclus sp. F158]|uniref:MBL fold metallo-hydrolase n=1 Tax=Tropicimonas omnivorans TaxID=3075590 RepID=A0ABU3DG95_9RHOB|nr:MBL fold metallo-hydrolase [Roseicyclus sp. F158]MDT0682714.1 MBL fold metallo-hydrolase [Roseicyclus sp. F158]
MTLSRRTALFAGAALPLAATFHAAPARAQEADGASRSGLPSHATLTVGAITVTPLLTSTNVGDDPHSIFGLNVDDETFAAASEERFIPSDRSISFYLPTVVQTDGNTILFDTGNSADEITVALDAAGMAPSDITHVVITHMHPDHIRGLMTEGGEPVFPDAEYISGRVEAEWWAENPNDAYEANIAPLIDRFTLVEDGAEIAPGITAMAAFGHTPGHMTYMIESEDTRLLLMADVANHYVWSVGHPDWEVRYDQDKEMAAETRRRVLGMAAEERFPVLGYHMPFPGVGFIEVDGDGFRFVPHTYQLSF